MLPSKVKLVEVGPRDGLQNESPVSLSTRLALIRGLYSAGLRHIEAGSLVSPSRVPQMAHTDQLFTDLMADTTLHEGSFPVLVANQRGLEQAIMLGVKEIAVFGSASEQFCQHNIGCSVAESRQRFAALIEQALSHGMQVRGYLSCVMGCPYQGEIAYQATAELAAEYYQLGCYEISLGDTIGLGTPKQALALFEQLTRQVPMSALAAHFHDTRGQALANIYALLQEGLSVIDTSVSGLGGCPYAPGASGNVATEDVVYMLHGLGIESGVDLNALAKVGWQICNTLELIPRSKVALTLKGR